MCHQRRECEINVIKEESVKNNVTNEESVKKMVSEYNLSRGVALS